MNYRVTFHVGIVAAIAALFWLPELAWAQIPANASEEILIPFRQLRADHMVPIRDAARVLFYSLLLIELTLSACTLVWNGADLNSFGRWITERFILSGIMVYIFTYGPSIGSDIQDTLRDVSLLAGGVASNPSEVLDLGVNISGKLAGAVGWWDGGEAIPVLFASILMALIFAAISANMMVVLAEIYIVSTLGIFLLGFAGGSWTRDYAIGYFRWLLAVVFKLAAMQLLVGEGLSLVSVWVNNLVSSTASIQNASMLTLLGTVLIIYTLSKTIPDSAADMIRGTSSGGMGSVAASAAALGSSMKSVSQKMVSAARGTASGAAKGANAIANSSFGASAGSMAAKTVSGAAGNSSSGGKSGGSAKGPVAARRK